jgi:hypothetical protein
MVSFIALRVKRVSAGSQADGGSVKVGIEGSKFSSVENGRKSRGAKIDSKYGIRLLRVNLEVRLPS